MYKNYIFDLYGTLIDIRTDEWSDEIWDEYAAYLTGIGIPYTGSEVHKMYDNAVAELVGKPSPYDVPEIDIIPVFDKICRRHRPDISAEEVWDATVQFRITTTKMLKLYKNSRKVLDGLRAAGKKVYLLSNAQRAFTWQELEKTGIVECFDDIMISSDAGCKKPDAAFYRMLMDKHGLDVKECVMIGNDSTSDIAGAGAVGMDAFYVRTEISPGDDPVPACEYIYEDGDIGHVLELIKKDYDTVIFDLDGTLLNTLDDLCDSTNYALKQFGYPERSKEEVRNFVGNGIRKLLERALPESVPESVLDEFYVEFKRHYKAHCNDKTCAYDGIIELLTKLKKRGIKTGIASNKDKTEVNILKDLYFDGLIDAAAGSVTGKPTKPDPYMVEELLKDLGSDKEHTLYVGDSQVDVQTAGNTGLNMTAVLWGFRNREQLVEAGANKFIEHPLELLKFI